MEAIVCRHDVARRELSNQRSSYILQINCLSFIICGRGVVRVRQELAVLGTLWLTLELRTTHNQYRLLMFKDRERPPNLFRIIKLFLHQLLVT